MKIVNYLEDFKNNIPEGKESTQGSTQIYNQTQDSTKLILKEADVPQFHPQINNKLLSIDTFHLISNLQK